jgi:hypothetical protein
MRVLAMWICALLTLQGCSVVQTVEPWQKGNLAKPEMTFDDDPLSEVTENTSTPVRKHRPVVRV